MTASATHEPAAVRLPQWNLVRCRHLESGAIPRPHAGKLGVASTFVVSMDTERKSLFMVRLVIVPLLLIVMLSWSVFWMDQSSLGDRISVSFIGILTVVAYQIVLSEILPRISYLTLMNGFLNMSFFVVCASVVVSLWVGCARPAGADRNRRPDRSTLSMDLPGRLLRAAPARRWAGVLGGRVASTIFLF